MVNNKQCKKLNFKMQLINLTLILSSPNEPEINEEDSR